MKAYQDLLQLTMKKTGSRFNPSNIRYVLDFLEDLPTCRHSNVTYFNIPCAFDIETTSFYDDNGLKTAIMYEWTFGINGLVIIGRTWRQFILMMNVLTRYLEIDEHKRLVCYIHNAGYEMQFFRRYFNWVKIFALEERRPIYMLCDRGIEFRCSYLLSGYSLEKLGDQLLKYKVNKMVGDLDYSLIRHSKTKLTDRELGYCINDVLVVMSYIQEKLENEGAICYIPKTKTGYVRNYCRNYCFYEYGKSRKDSRKKTRYMKLMSTLKMTEPEYKQLKRAFAGGFTHASAFFSGRIMKNVTSIDFTSSYPTVMIAEQFPMSSAELIDIKDKKDFYHNLKYYCCLFDAHFEGLESTFFNEHYLSESHCMNKKGMITDNGRVVSAESFDVTLTEQDYLIIRRVYTWKKLSVGNFRRYHKGYLPRDFIKAILSLYSKKTMLKNVDGKELEYLKSKEMINACYGMSVTDPCRSEILYDYEWSKKDPDIKEILEKYNKSSSRFLFYPWGVWVTAYARRNLWTGILECNDDYIYSDTDSIKIRNYESHKEYIEKYNNIITAQLHNTLYNLHISEDKLHPKTVEGVEKPLGVWDFDGCYSRFLTLGAKRYMVEYAKDPRNKEKDRGKISLTVSGLNKKVAIPYLKQKYGDGIFQHFNNDLYVPGDYTGTNTHTYIDEPREGVVTDYMGVSCHYREETSLHIEKSSYTLSLSKDYRDYLLEVDISSLC